MLPCVDARSDRGGVSGGCEDPEVLTITDDQRRARLGARHALASRVRGPEEVVDALTCLHATEPASVYLSVAARSDAGRAEVHRALYTERTVVKQLAMRRTLFAFPRDALPAAWGSASARVAAQIGARLAKEVVAGGLADDGPAWVEQWSAAVLQRLRDDGPAGTAELREALPELGRRLETAPGKAYGGSFPVAPRLLSVLAAGGVVLRGENQGDWRTSRPRWTATEHWLGETPRPATPEAGYLDLVTRWLRRFGPGTEADLVWWLGATKSAVRRALAEAGAVGVALDHGPGWVLPDDLEPVAPVEPWAALLPVLDPTVMGWRDRAFYLDPDDVPLLFDVNGNAGTTAWWDGRVVGCWVQDDDGVVQVVPIRDVGDEARAALGREAERLTGWLAGDRVATVYPSAAMRAARPG